MTPLSAADRAALIRSAQRLRDTKPDRIDPVDPEIVNTIQLVIARYEATLAALETELAACRAAPPTTRIPCAGCGTGVRPAAGRYCAACQERLAAKNARLRAGIEAMRLPLCSGCEEAGYPAPCCVYEAEHNARIDALLTEAAP